MNKLDFLAIDFTNYFAGEDKYAGYCAVTQLWWHVDKVIAGIKQLRDSNRIECG
jgi:hypothetical protein